MKNLVWLLFFSLIACSRHSESVEAYDFSLHPYITLDFHDQKEFKLDSVNIISFVFSPLQLNHLWVSTYGMETYDLDLETGAWIIMPELKGENLFNLKQEDIHIDPYDEGKVWIASQNGRLMLYNRPTKEQIVFSKIGRVACIMLDTSSVWIGHENGLSRYDRKEMELIAIDEVPRIKINLISTYTGNAISLNGQYVYDGKFRLLEKLGEPIPFPLNLFPYQNLTLYLDQNQYVSIKTKDSLELCRVPYSLWNVILFEKDNIWVPLNELSDGLARIDVQHQTVDTIPIGYYVAVEGISADDEFVWVRNRRESVAINKQTGEAKLWSLPYQSNRSILYQDSKYLYLQDQHSVSIIRNAKLLEESRLVVDLKEEFDSFNRLVDSTRINQTYDIHLWYSSYKKINTAIKNTNSPRILASLNDISNRPRFIAPNPRFYEPFDDSLFSFVDSIEEPDVKMSFTHPLIVYAARKGRLDIAIQLDEKLKLDSIVVDTNEYAERQKIEIRKAYRALQSVNEKELPGDERLWLTGNIYLELFRTIARDREVGTDNDLPLSFYYKLVKTYPSSPWADNAAYLLLNHDERGEYEGGDDYFNLEYLTDYKKLIQRYPDSEIIPDIYYRIAQMYTQRNYVPNDIDTKKGLENAKKYTSKFYAEYPGHPLTAEVDQFVTYINAELDNLKK